MSVKITNDVTLYRICFVTKFNRVSMDHVLAERRQRRN
jgi:hypothetical protein